MSFVYVVKSHQRYEGSYVLRICSSYGKAFEYLGELVKGKDNQWADRWNDDNLSVFLNHDENEETYCTYTDIEDSERWYSIDREKVY